MININTTVTGIDRALDGLHRMETSGAQAQQSVIQPLGTDYLATLISEGPVGKGPASGRQRLYQNYVTSERYGATDAEYRITNRSPWLRWVINGRGPVVAKRGKTLRFEILGEVFFRKRVGPVAPNNFPARVKQRMEPRIGIAMRQIVTVIVKLFEGGA